MNMEYDNYGEGGFNVDAQYSDYNNSQRQQTRSSLSPVTIKEINEATQPVPDGEFMIHNVALNMVSFIGIIRKVDNNSSAVTITIEDGTGSMEVRKWIDEKVSTAAEEAEKFQALENKYVYVTGGLKEFNLKKSIQHANIREITDHNEVAYHMLYAISNYLEAQGILNKAPKKEENGLFVKDNDLSTSGGTDVTRRIEKVIDDNTGSMQEGVPISWISETLGLPIDVVRDQCQHLSEQGKIYQGYDEGSFLSVNA
uniref:Replication protein A C-terminal domain-containing protein n=1 Tax=Candidozyma auris TaxID=498019 RepID=A0A0L0NRK2_CANAR